MVWSMESPLNAMEQVQRMGANRLRGQVAQMDMMQQGQDMSNEMAMNALYKQVGGDPVKMQQALTASGNMKGAMAFGKMNAGAQQAQQEAKLGDLSFRQKAHEYLGNRIYNSGSQQELDAIRQEGYGMLGDEMDNLPAEWSPEMARHYGEASMTFAQREAMQQKQEDAQMRREDRQENMAFRREMRDSGQQKAPAGYVFAPDGQSLSAIKGGPADQKQQINNAKMQKLEEAKSSAIASTRDALNLIDTIENHPGLSKTTGLSSYTNKAAIAGGDSANFQAQMDQLKGQQFMEAYKSLKGGGQITEVEGKKATDALAALGYSQDEKQFRENLAKYKAVVQRIADDSENTKTGFESENSQQPRVFGNKPATAMNKSPSGLSPDDTAAVEWAKQNSQDPRAVQILKIHGL